VRAAEVLEKSIFGLAFISFHEERLDESAQLFDRVAANASSPVAGRAAFQAGRALMKLDRPQDAAARFEKAAGDLRESAGDLHEESLLRLGECYQKLGKHADAVRVLDRELAEYPEGALRHEARFARGYALQLEGQRGPAVEAYRAVVIGTRAPVAARAQYHIGECLLDDGKNRDAAREFAAVVANFDFAGEYAEWVRRALLAAGLAYQAAGDAAAANAQFKELSERFPQTEEGKVAAARLRDAAAGN
jgi:TolA-binding protein